MEERTKRLSAARARRSAAPAPRGWWLLRIPYGAVLRAAPSLGGGAGAAAAAAVLLGLAVLAYRSYIGPSAAGSLQL